MQEGVVDSSVNTSIYCTVRRHIRRGVNVETTATGRASHGDTNTDIEDDLR